MASHFDGQDENEEVILVFRRHPIALRKGFYAIVIPFIALSIPFLLTPENIDYFWVSMGGLGLGLILFFYHWVGWYFSVFVLTNQRFRQVTQKGFFNRSVIDVGISRIQNISYNIPGFSATLLGFGNIALQTYVGDILLDRIHHPDTAYEKLQQAIKKYGGGEEPQGQDYEEATT